MQNRYVGDIGDYLKLSILRTLSPGYRLGVAWWLFTDETHNGDGRHVGYLKRPDLWRHLDPELFDALRHVVLSGQRNVRALRAPGLIPGAIYADDVIPTGGPIAQRLSARRAWLAGVQRALEQANVLFLDPDNGLEPAGFRPTALKSGKSIMLTELPQLSPISIRRMQLAVQRPWVADIRRVYCSSERNRSKRPTSWSINSD
jgi:hypothetical protein